MLTGLPVKIGNALKSKEVKAGESDFIPKEHSAQLFCAKT